LYKDQLRIAAELDSAGNIAAQFTYLGSNHSPDYMSKSGVLYRFVKDQVGSVRLVVNTATGVIAQSIDYDEFGRVLMDTNPGFQPFGFAGGLYDADTGLVRFGAVWCGLVRGTTTRRLGGGRVRTRFDGAGVRRISTFMSGMIQRTGSIRPDDGDSRGVTRRECLSTYLSVRAAISTQIETSITVARVILQLSAATGPKTISNSTTGPGSEVSGVGLAARSAPTTLTGTSAKIRLRPSISNRTPTRRGTFGTIGLLTIGMAVALAIRPD
jgi:hypothetical protein